MACEQAKAAAATEPGAPMMAAAVVDGGFTQVSQTQPFATQNLPVSNQPALESLFARLVRRDGGEAGVYELRKDQEQVFIGRHKNCDIHVPQQQVSSKHVRIYRDSMFRYFAEVLGTAPCYLGDTLMRKGDTRALQHGDELSLLVPPHHKGEVAPFAVFMFFQVALPQEGTAGPAPYSEEDVAKLWSISHTLGSGNFSEVKLGVKVKSEPQQGKVQRAVKIIDKKKFQQFQKKRESRLALSEEAEMLMKLDHPGIIRVYEYYETPEHLYLIMDLMEGGDLLQSLLADGCFTEGQARRFFSQLLGTVKYLHMQNIVHRDLKPENILVNTRDRSQMRPKIADFGLARHNMKSRDCRTFCGTPSYFAPEVINTLHDRENRIDTNATGYGKQVDMWSLGVILYILLSGVPPFEEDYLYEQIIAGKYEFDVVEWRSVSEEGKELVANLMVVEPSGRLKIEQACSHKWFCKGVTECDSSPPLPLPRRTS